MTFEDLKRKKLSSTPILKFLDFTKLFKIHTNASDFTIGRVLMHEGHSITFESKKLYGAHLKWPIHEKELYIVVCCLNTWQQYLATHKTKVFMNYISLKYFETPPKASTKQLTWHDTLALLDVELITN
jgi:hypothetical protein